MRAVRRACFGRVFAFGGLVCLVWLGVSSLLGYLNHFGVVLVSLGCVLAPSP